MSSNNNNNDGDVDQKFKKRILGSLDMVKAWEDDVELFKDIRSTIPWKELQNPNGMYSNNQSNKDRLLTVTSSFLFSVDNNDNNGTINNTLLVQRLARWFQKSFMKWVNNPPCNVCQCKETQFKVVRGPETQEEKDGQATRVEVYFCPQCNADTTTFPRYNRPKKLFETRKGRCGEYANIFGCICRAVGLETRLVVDFSDHVWTEVRLNNNSNGAIINDDTTSAWLMVDSCEGVLDEPSMYEHGWGKGPKLSYMIAIANDHIIDVTSKYTRNFIKEDFQMRRRQYTSSEDASARIIQQINDTLWNARNIPAAKRDELIRRNKIETAELQTLKQSTEWSEQEKYGRGRISGSLAWKQSRSEAGNNNNNPNNDNNKKSRSTAGFQVESFYPPTGNSKTISLQVFPNPKSHHGGIVVSNTSCAVGEPDSVSVVVVDEACLGCILQSRSFLTWGEVQNFIDHLPSNRIVLMNGSCKDATAQEEKKDEKEESKPKKIINISRLGGWKSDCDASNGILYIGQVDANPDWTFFCDNLQSDTVKDGYVVELEKTASSSSSSSSSSSRPEMQLRTERQTMPLRVAGRLPESAMPLQTQLLATEEQKRLAFISFCSSPYDSRYCGYTTKPKSPIYLLDSTSYPFSKIDDVTAIIDGTSTKKEDVVWNTFHYLPSPLVPKDDHGIVSKTAAADFAIPKYDVPTDSNFFVTSLGNQLIGRDGTTRLPTGDALYNARLIGLYFSAHWCGPCRSFTPMLAEMYEHLKEERPSHGLEIVFVSSDRDANSFQGYFRNMPWLAIPFENLPFVKPGLSATYGVRGIPSLVILDAVSGQVVISAGESRQEVAMACRGGDASIEKMLDSWLARTPQETREILSMLEMSCQEEEDKNDDKNNNDDDKNPYLITESPIAVKPFDLAAEVKRIFAKLVAEGNEPNAAAAKALVLAAEEQKKSTKQQQRQFDQGSLHGKALRTGPPEKTSLEDALDEAFASVLALNDSSSSSSSSVVVANTILTTASKYVKNAIKEPWSPKFRTLKLSNKVADQITRVEGGLNLLQCLGLLELFGSISSQDFKATIPVACDLDGVMETINKLLEGVSVDK